MKIPAPDVVAAAQGAALKYDVFASVSIGQYALESRWGALCTGKFNFFGIKATPSQPGTLCWTHEVVNGRTIAVQARFRDFADLQQAFEYHAALIALDHRYASAMAHKGDLNLFVRCMAPIYATDPDYATNLLNLIKEDGLTRYDKPAA
jgi:flagellum-specific peptidoglycan hydrolase FlgJ